MALRFFSKSYSTTSGVVYQVQIHDTEFAGTAVEFECGPDIFTLSNDGQMSKKPVYIQAGELNFQMYIDSGTKRTFVSALSDAQEGQYQIKVFRNGSFWWCGNIVTDQVSHPDLESYFLQIQATDMLGSLQNVDYNDDGTEYTGTETFIGIVQKCLSKTGLLDFGWGASDVCIRTADNLYEDQMPTGTANDPLALARVNQRTYFDIDNQGVRKFTKCYEVLESILKEKDLVLKQSAGSWRLYQYAEMAEATLTAERRYDRAGAYLSSAAAVDITKTLDQDTNTALKENIPDFSWYAPFAKVQIAYEAKNTVNYLAGEEWTASDERDFESINHNGGLANISFEFTLKQNFNFFGGTPSTTGPVFALWRLTIKVGDRYLKRSVTSIGSFTYSYSAASWTTVASTFDVIYESDHPPGAFTISDTHNEAYYSPSLEASGTLTVDVQYIGLRLRSNGNPVSFASSHNLATSAKGRLYAYSNGSLITENINETFCAENDLANATSEELNLLVLIGDGPTVNSLSRIEVYDGADWVDSETWSEGGGGSGLPINSLLAKEIMARRKTPAERMSGDIWDYTGTMAMHSRVDDNSSGAIWFMVRGSYNARMERYTGEWFFLTHSPTDITVADPVSIDPVGPPRVTPGGGLVNPVGTSVGTSAGGWVPILTGGGTGATVSTGAVTSIPLSAPTNAGAYQTGQVLSLVNPITGLSQNFTVTADSSAGDTSVSVSGYAIDDFPTGSFLAVSPQNQTVQGFAPSASGGTSSPVSNTQTSNWWNMFQQWWEVDDTNDIEFPIEAPDIVLETDENAGNGSTAGVRFDGDGLTAYNAASQVPGVKIGPDGMLSIQSFSHETFAAGVLYNLVGVLHVANNVSTYNPQHGHIHRMQVVGYNTEWTAGVTDSFWRITSEFVGYTISRIGYGTGATVGSGSGTNEVRIFHQNSAGTVTTTVKTVTIGATSNNLTSADNAVTLVQGDLIYFQVISAKSTPARGFVADLYLTK